MLQSPAEIPVLFRVGDPGYWREQAASTLPYINNGDNQNLNYNSVAGSTWGQTPVANTKFVTYTLISTNDWMYPIKMVQGNQQYDSKADALQNASDEMIAWGTLPSAEFDILFRFILQTGVYAGVKNAQIIEVTDFRMAHVSGVSASAQDHGTLAGLNDDDHAQYILHSLATAANDFLVASGSGAYVKKTLAETLALISPLTTRGDIMFRNATVSTRLAKGADNTILAMGANDPEWKTPATILADLSGQAGAAFAWNSQNLTGIGDLTLSGDIFVGSNKGFDAGAAFAEVKTTAAQAGLKLTSTQDGPVGAVMRIQHISASPAIGDVIGQFQWYANNSTPALHHYGDLNCLIVNKTLNSEESKFDWRLRLAGAANIAAVLYPIGGLWVDKYFEVTETSAPGAGAANTARMYAVVGGDTLTDLAAVFQDGTVDIFAQESTPLDSPIFTQASGVVVKRKMMKPHPGIIQFVEEYPNGKTFVTRELQYHDVDKIKANKGCDGKLPDGWEVTTLQERVDKQVAILDSEIASLVERENMMMGEVTDIMTMLETIKPVNEVQRQQLATFEERLESIPDDIEELNHQLEELRGKKLTELARTA